MEMSQQSVFQKDFFVFHGDVSVDLSQREFLFFNWKVQVDLSQIKFLFFNWKVQVDLSQIEFLIGRFFAWKIIQCFAILPQIYKFQGSRELGRSLQVLL